MGVVCVCESRGWLVYSTGYVNPDLVFFDLAADAELFRMPCEFGCFFVNVNIIVPITTCASGPVEGVSGFQSIAVSASGEYLAAVTDVPDFRLTVFHVPSRAVLARVHHELHRVSAVTFNPANEHEIVVFVPGKAHLFTLEQCRTLAALVSR